MKKIKTLKEIKEGGNFYLKVNKKYLLYTLVSYGEKTMVIGQRFSDNITVPLNALNSFIKKGQIYIE